MYLTYSANGLVAVIVKVIHDVIITLFFFQIANTRIYVIIVAALSGVGLAGFFGPPAAPTFPTTVE